MCFIFLYYFLLLFFIFSILFLFFVLSINKIRLKKQTFLLP